MGWLWMCQQTWTGGMTRAFFGLRSYPERLGWVVPEYFGFWKRHAWMRPISQFFLVCSFNGNSGVGNFGHKRTGVFSDSWSICILFSEGCLTVTVLAQEFSILLDVDLLRRIRLPGAVGHGARSWSRTIIGGVRARVGCKAECRGQASRKARLVVPDFEALQHGRASGSRARTGLTDANARASCTAPFARTDSSVKARPCRCYAGQPSGCCWRR